MTETTTNTDAVTEAAAKPQNAANGSPDAQPHGDTQSATEGAETTTGNKEAAKYRRQLREAEAERDAAQTLIADARRQLLMSKLPTVEHAETTTDLAGNTSTAHHGTLRAEALGDSGIDINDVFDGMTVNEDKLRSELAKIYEEKPYLFVAPRMIVPNEGTGNDSLNARRGFTAAFSPER